MKVDEIRLVVWSFNEHAIGLTSMRVMRSSESR